MTSIIPGIEIRSSSWGTLLDCSSRWSAIHLEGMKMPSSVPAMMGTAVHHGTAYFDNDRVDGKIPHLPTAMEAAAYKFHNPQEDVRWTSDDYSKQRALEITLKATQSYCTQISPLFDYTAVELRPVPLDVNVEGVIIRISGQMDRTRISKTSNGVGITDVKTGKTIVNAHGQVNTQGHKFQIGIYELLAEHSLGVKVTEDGMIAAVTTTDKPRTGVGVIRGGKELMLGTDEQPGMIETAGKMVKAGLFPPNPQSRLCSPKWCVRWNTCKAHG